MQVLYTNNYRINILLNDDLYMIIATEDLEVLKKVSVDDYYAPAPEELINIFKEATKEYFNIESNDNNFKQVRENMYNHCLDNFLKSDFLKEYKEHFEEA